MIQTNFKRYELKYILTVEQYKVLLNQMPEFIQLDEYGKYKINNIYFDTDDFRIIRHSIEKPKYKEKLRIRCYGEPSDTSKTFIEIKKKFNGVVFKRRVLAKQNDVLSYLDGDNNAIECSQILNEIDYFKGRYDGIKPKVYICYEREAFFSKEDKEFRLTCDFNIKTRDRDISFFSSDYDMEVLSSDYVVLEVKTVMGLPNWFLEFLSKNRIYKTSFSKYGTAYKIYYMQKFINTLGRAANV